VTRRMRKKAAFLIVVGIGFALVVAAVLSLR
jgi:predicted nucleic acid-binding Zn ribbon protein